MADIDIRREKALDLLGDLTVSFGETERPQYVQDLPIRLNVWRAFAENPIAKHSLLITPNNRVQISHALTELRASFQRAEFNDVSLIAIKNMIWTQVTLDQFFMAILPSTYWYQDIPSSRLVKWWESFEQVRQASDLADMQRAFRNAGEKDLWRVLAGWSVIDYSQRGKEGDSWGRLAKSCTALLAVTTVDDTANIDTARQERIFNQIKTFLDSVRNKIDKLEKYAAQSQVASIWAVDLNRRAELATNVSRNTVKIDAAERLFEGTAKAITWAVIDSGVDATHPAFSDSIVNNDVAAPQSTSRVIATYDFNRLMLLSEQRYKELVPAKVLSELETTHYSKTTKKPESLNDAILMLLFKLNAPRVPKFLSQRSLDKSLEDDGFSTMVHDYIEDVKRKITIGEPIDWALLEPLLRVPHTEDGYVVPVNGHGTHVAGTIAGNLPAGALHEPDDEEASDEPRLPKRAIRGMCPDMKIYDLRVCDNNGRGDEFLVVSALQFIDYLNKSQDRMVVHGANISLQIHHLVRNYGCGQTPVCREANNLVANGVVVVVAAGNRGFNKVQTEDGPIDTYSWSSITDPGNAKDVITVGSTHRQNPFSYGVSYFSSRGPTGDGRSKPDLVAPGEKIVAPLPGRRIGSDTGTSMAAPHVSGSAAQLLARYPELVGNPLRLKQILCDSATDLGRRKEFQGSGLVDVLRALQSL